MPILLDSASESDQREDSEDNDPNMFTVDYSDADDGNDDDDDNDDLMEIKSYIRDSAADDHLHQLLNTKRESKKIYGRSYHSEFMASPSLKSRYETGSISKSFNDSFKYFDLEGK